MAARRRTRYNILETIYSSGRNFFKSLKSTVYSLKLTSGFSLIEVIVVIALFAITSIVVTTSYIGFEGRERLKNAALQLKSDLRFVQSKAQSGDKGLAASTCATVDSLVGWYVTFSLTGTTYTYAGDCLTRSDGITDTAFASSTAKLPTDVTISALEYNGLPVNNGVLTILFKPLDYSVLFYSAAVPVPNFTNDTTKLLETGLSGASPDEVTITLQNSNGDYQVKINRSGEVHEVRI